MVTHVIAVNALVTANDPNYNLLGSLTGAPTGIYAWCTVYYRRVAT